MNVPGGPPVQFVEQSDMWLVVATPPSPNVQATVQLRNLETGDVFPMSRADARQLGELLRKIEYLFGREASR